MSIIKTTTGTVTYRLKKNKTSKECPIIFDYSYGRGNRLKISTGYKVLIKHWDQKNQKIRNISTITNREEINNKLLLAKSKFMSSLATLSSAERENKEVLKKKFSVAMNWENEEELKKQNFFKYAQDFIELQEKSSNSSDFKLSKITIRAYNQTIKQLKAFDKKHNYNLDFDKFDMSFYYKFIGFLEEESYSLNTIGKHIKNIIALLNRATEDGFNNNLKYKHRDFKRVSEKTVSIYLTIDEIESIYKLDLSFNKDWERARDIFMIGYYTGQRVSDYNGLTKENIKVFDGREVFEIYQKKTKKTVYIPVHNKIKEIMSLRYDGALPNKLSDQQINEYIKPIGRKAGITEEVGTQITVGGKIKRKKVPKYKLIGTHTARRSFCTNAYLSKMPVIDIMALSGHTTEREFYNYIKVTPQERAIKIADSEFFK